MNREAAIEHLRHSKLASHLEALVEVLRPSVRLHRRPVAIDDAPIGASRFGGPPDLPPGLPWPSWEITKRSGLWRRKTTTTRASLDFLGQINLAQLAELGPDVIPDGFPTAGMLYLFYDIDEQPWGYEPEHALGFRVAIATDASQLDRRAGPPASRTGVPRPCLILPEAEWVLPDWPECLDGHGVAVETDDIDEVVTALYASGGDVVHRMFGYPQCIQDPDDLFAGEDASMLLMQVDSDDRGEGAPGWMWGDAGRLYFTIPPSDLAILDPTSIRMRLQCY